jgi:hypothetical protein
MLDSNVRMRLFIRSLKTLAVIVAAGPAIAPAPMSAATPARWDVNPNLARHDHHSKFWRNWIVDEDSSAITADGIQLLLRPIQYQNEPLKSDWWKAGLVHPAAMASDGVFADGDQAGIELVLRNLPAGRHSLATFHNSLWKEDLCSFDIRVNNQMALEGLQPSRRVSDDYDATCGYVEFTAVDGQDVTVHIVPRGRGGSDALNRVVLNGIELDGPDPQHRAGKPSPAMGDEHVAERPTLAWRPPSSAVAHDVYFGTSRTAVAEADRSSPEYRGRLTSPEYASDADDPFAAYYWRVEEVFDDAGDEVVRGDVWRFGVRRLAFPTAQGWGRFARGGRGGRVIEVTNLNDSGPGSLRAAVEEEGPRTIVFAVSGLITLESRLVVKNPYVTVAGQTAPGKGICIRKYTMGLGGAHDAIVQHVRVRPGTLSGRTLDGMGMASSDHSIIDHCSISWSHDEAFSSRAAKNITLQHTLISEALNDAGHKKYPPGTQHGYAASIGGKIGSFHRNLLAHCAGRNWSLAGGLDLATRHTGWLDIRNNVVFNWKHRTTDGGAARVQFVNNYYKPGPATQYLKLLNPERKLVAAFGPQDYFVEGNVLEGHVSADEPLAGVTQPEPYDQFISEEPFFEPHVETMSADDAYAAVLSDVGCNQPRLDEHDARVIDEVLAGTAAYSGSRTGLPGLPDSEQDVGGWEDYPQEHRPTDWDADHDGMPNWWEEAHSLDPQSKPGDFADSNADADGDGYTNLEEFLHWMSQPHFDCEHETVSVDLKELARGFGADAEFEVHTPVNGSVKLSADSTTARFTPAEKARLGGFSATVRNANGFSLTRTIGIRIVR